MLLPPPSICANILIYIALTLVSTTVSANDSIELLDEMHVIAEPENYFTDDASTATRNNSSLFETPYSVGTLSAELLADTLPNRLEESSKFISGVQQGTGDSGFNTDLIIRGFSTGANNYLNGLSDNQKFFTREMATVERIEILKGQSSVLYGSGSPAGVVNYLSKKPQRENRQTVSISAGSYDYGKLVFDSTGKINGNENLLYRFIGVGQIADNFRENIINNRATFAPSITWKYADSGSITSEFEYNHDTQPYRFDNVYTPEYGVIYDKSYVDPRTQSDRNYFRFSNTLTQQLLPNWSAHLQSHYYHTERHDVLFGFYTFQTPTTLSGYYRNIRDYYDQLNLRGELHGNFLIAGNKNQLIVGVERHEGDDRLHSQRRIGGYKLDIFNPTFSHPIPSTSALNAFLHTTEYGYYANNQLDLGKFWHLSGGLRYSDFNATQNAKKATEQDALTFSGGISFTPFENTAFYFGYSDSFQPNYGQTKQKDFLPAKKGELLETGIKTQWLHKKLHWNATIYQLSQTNLITKDPNDPDFVVTNGAIRSQGFETEISAQLTENWYLLGNYSLIDSKFLKHDYHQGNLFTNTPKHSGLVWTKYRVPLDSMGKIYIGGGATFVDARFGDNANSFRVSGYIRPDLSVQYQWQNYELNCNIENLFDKRYVASSIYDDTVVQGNRLFFKLTATVHF